MGQILEYIKIAVMNIRNNKGRSLLTMLGIIIGIASVIMIIAIGNGLYGTINGELNDLVSGIIYLSINGEKTDKTLDQSDLDAMMEVVDGIDGVTPGFGIFGKATSRKGSFDVSIDAGNEYMQLQFTDKIVKGHYYTRQDVENANLVCVLREADAKNLFGTTDIIGMTFELDCYGISQSIRVVGIREDSPSQLVSAATGAIQILQLEMPHTVFQQYYRRQTDAITNVYIFTPADRSSEVATRCINYLENRLDIRGQQAISVQNFADLADQFSSILGYITAFVALVAAISLLVGGIGVMNIMLVSVTERTREIGIRKSLGARTGSILLQFLAEAGIITFLGGVIGIVVGMLGAFLICNHLNFTPSISPGLILMTTLFSSAVGIFFGIYPARKAARLSPIEALRHD
ncbi:MAG: ABC transporter permease [Lachnospiraceae bacterium]|nr:ABC transporter permease [Lachnospiraceae bacterium]